MEEKTPLDLINTLKDVPAMPNVIIRALGIINDDSSGTKELSEIMAYDQALTSQVLKLVNSAYYGFAQEITSIKNAIALLGMTQTKNIVIAVAMKPMLTSQCGKDMWRHSLKTAVASELLAKNFDFLDPNDAFTIGFLHDIGKVILNLCDSKKYQGVKELIQNGGDQLAAEERIFDINHADVGFMLAKKWKLPVLLANCIKYHHDPLRSSMPKASSLIYLANMISQPGEELPKMDYNILDEVGIDPSQLIQFKADAEALTDTLSLKLGS